MKILNSKGEPITLTDREQKVAQVNQQLVNSLGYEIDITTLTTIMKKVTEQKFFQISPADYLPVRVGEGAWSQQLITYRSMFTGDEFEKGVIGMGSANSRLASADAAVDSVAVKVINWAKSIGWTLFDLQMAAKAGNWDIVTAKEKSRKKNWDLGIQAVAFLGLAGDTAVEGLLTLSGLSSTDTTTITEPISGMTTTELKTLCTLLIEKYRNNCARTAFPTHFIIPESDYNGLAAQASADFPIKSTLQVLEEMFQTITMNKGFKVLPLAYADAAYNKNFINVGTGKQCYVLLNYDEETLRMDIPVDYTNTLANSIDNFSFQNVGYGQFTGAKAYRPKEIYYLQY